MYCNTGPGGASTLISDFEEKGQVEWRDITASHGDTERRSGGGGLVYVSSLTVR